MDIQKQLETYLQICVSSGIDPDPKIIIDILHSINDFQKQIQIYLQACESLRIDFNPQILNCITDNLSVPIKYNTDEKNLWMCRTDMKKKDNKSVEKKGKSAKDTIEALFQDINNELLVKAQSNMDAILMEKYTKMFRQPFDQVAGSTEGKINNYRYIMWGFVPNYVTSGIVGRFSKMVEVDTNPKRYFTLECSFHGLFMLCEWKFDGLIKTEHINYGPIIFSIVEMMQASDILIKKIEEILNKSLKKFEYRKGLDKEELGLMSLVLAHDEITETQYTFDTMLREKYTKMFRQYFDAVANITKGKINDFNYTMYSFTPSNMYCGDGGEVGMFLKVVVVDTNPQRYFAVERSFHGQSMLCEWKFDGLEETEHLNYGPIISSLFDEINLADILINKLKKY